MPIQEQNIQFVASQVMDDVGEGGGAATGNVIVDGQINNVFDDISDLDRAYGRFNLRKLFVAVRTASTDLFGGARTVVTALPEDEALSYTLFSTANAFDQRAAAAGKVAAYLYRGAEWQGFLLENHIAGMRSVQIFQRPNTALPEQGQTLVITQGTTEQYVRATRVTAETRIYSYVSGSSYVDYEAVVATVELSDALRADYSGTAANRTFTRGAGAAVIRDVVVADATRYYGAVRLAQAASVGDLTLRAESIYTRLVPSAQTETALIDKPLVGDTLPLVASSPAAITRTLNIGAIAAGGHYVLPTGCLPGSLVLAAPGGNITDSGSGGLLRGGASAGSINYVTGELSLTASIAAGSVTETYRPAAPVAGQGYTQSKRVTEATRAFVWVFALDPLPAPGAAQFSYMAGGRWYSLADNGLGQIQGSETSLGTGTISYVTGSVSLTLGALPDVGSVVLASWGTPAEVVRLTDASIGIDAPKIEFALGTAIDAGTLHLSWKVAGATVTASDDSAGNLTGAAAGKVAYGAGTGWMRTNAMPDPGTLTASYDSAGSLTHGATVSAGTTISGTLPGFPLEPGSISASVLVSQALATADELGHVAPSSEIVPGTIRDDGAGGWSLDGHGALPTSSINYSTGAYSIVLNINTVTPVAIYKRVAADGGESPYGAVKVFTGYSASTVTRQWAGGAISFRYRAASSATTPATKDAGTLAFSVDLLPYLKGTLIAGSLRFTLGGLLYVDRAGKLYHSIDPLTGSGTEAGAIDYATGIATVSAWASGAWSFALAAGLVNPGTPGQVYFMGRTLSRPLKSQSFIVTATALDGTTITATAGADSALNAAELRGTIDLQTGLYELRFGHASGSDWVSVLVDPATIRYSAVAYSYLPLDADVLGIDPVRLPPDGRVPIFRAGDVVQIMHASDTTGTPTLEAGKYVLSLGRTRIAWARVTGAEGQPITSGYTLDRDLGKIIFDALPASVPVTVRHTVSDLRRISDAQITGALTITGSPLTHNYPAGESIVSGCLIHGDRRARVSLLFDQATWSGAWSDDLIGSNATATLNTITHPVVVTNEGCETERWVLRWTTATAVELIGEHVGLVYAGPYAAGGSDIAPINPRTRGSDGQGGVPYLTIPGAANGGGWAAGNCVRINTVGALADMWIARAIQPSDVPAGDGLDGCEIYCLGNIDRP
ncbi:MAG: hypothetical protein REI09_11170 [Candidatus Dactylopiibacterium sp.]|nr:hypothetical protein [Candidatus Dactylopiibacterium sp.]